MIPALQAWKLTHLLKYVISKNNALYFHRGSRWLPPVWLWWCRSSWWWWTTRRSPTSSCNRCSARRSAATGCSPSSPTRPTSLTWAMLASPSRRWVRTWPETFASLHCMKRCTWLHCEDKGPLKRAPINLLNNIMHDMHFAIWHISTYWYWPATSSFPVYT